jgi:NDP-sugar pyrophosphorylase family protein/putative flippase GtrA
MQIIIAMSGYGERFRRAGYQVPKPMIEVEGKPIIAHVVDLFPGETQFFFVCNREHLEEPAYRMAETLRDIAPQGRIVPIEPHRLGPVHAALQVEPFLDPDQPTIINYCDFTCFWDYSDFKDFVVRSDSDGCVPAYRGFHPHSLGSTFYAYMREDGLWMQDIQEKQPFTDRPTDEYASSGTYYFKSAALAMRTLHEQMAEGLSVNDEYYVSLAYKVLAARGLKISVYELQHFMQWGTPQDLREYENWSRIFRRLVTDSGRRARQDGAVLLPMAGLGQRFADAGYTLPKPLIPVSGRPMVIQAVRDLPDAAVQKFVLRQGLAEVDTIERKLRSTFPGARFLTLDGPTEGQAITCMLGLDGLDPDASLTIGACDNGVLYDSRKFDAALAEDADVLVWVVRGHADGIRRPRQFGWVDADPAGRVTGVRVKAEPDDPTTDPLIIGAFTFRRAGDFARAAERLVARNGRVNSEFYVDSLIEDCLADLDVRLFEVDAYIGWGTPVDLQTFQYWQSCFHKWPSHPYRLEKDRRVPETAVAELERDYAAHPAPRPRGVPPPETAAPSDTGAPNRAGWMGELLRFLPVGGLAVLIDFIAYNLLTLLDMAPTPAKAGSFVAGAVFAFYGNRRFTFRRGANGGRGVAAFCAVYAIALLLNLAVNRGVLTLLAPSTLALQLGWFAATACSAAFNFIGMKLLVFRKVR